jgi:hypothetical protein
VTVFIGAVFHRCIAVPTNAQRPRECVFRTRFNSSHVGLCIVYAELLDLEQRSCMKPENTDLALVPTNAKDADGGIPQRPCGMSRLQMTPVIYLLTATLPSQHYSRGYEQHCCDLALGDIFVGVDVPRTWIGFSSAKHARPYWEKPTNHLDIEKVPSDNREPRKRHEYPANDTTRSNKTL